MASEAVSAHDTWLLQAPATEVWYGSDGRFAAVVTRPHTGTSHEDATHFPGGAAAHVHAPRIGNDNSAKASTSQGNGGRFLILGEHDRVIETVPIDVLQRASLSHTDENGTAQVARSSTPPKSTLELEDVDTPPTSRSGVSRRGPTSLEPLPSSPYTQPLAPMSVDVQLRDFYCEITRSDLMRVNGVMVDAGELGQQQLAFPSPQGDASGASRRMFDGGVVVTPREPRLSIARTPIAGDAQEATTPAFSLEDEQHKHSLQFQESAGPIDALPRPGSGDAIDLDSHNSSNSLVEASETADMPQAYGGYLDPVTQSIAAELAALELERDRLLSAAASGSLRTTSPPSAAQAATMPEDAAAVSGASDTSPCADDYSPHHTAGPLSQHAIAPCERSSPLQSHQLSTNTNDVLASTTSQQTNLNCRHPSARQSASEVEREKSVADGNTLSGQHDGNAAAIRAVLPPFNRASASEHQGQGKARDVLGVDAACGTCVPGETAVSTVSSASATSGTALSPSARAADARTDTVTAPAAPTSRAPREILSYMSAPSATLVSPDADPGWRDAMWELRASLVGSQRFSTGNAYGHRYHSSTGTMPSSTMRGPASVAALQSPMNAALARARSVPHMAAASRGMATNGGAPTSVPRSRAGSIDSVGSASVVSAFDGSHLDWRSASAGRHTQHAYDYTGRGLAASDLVATQSTTALSFGATRTVPRPSDAHAYEAFRTTDAELARYDAFHRVGMPSALRRLEATAATGINASALAAMPHRPRNASSIKVHTYVNGVRVGYGLQRPGSRPTDARIAAARDAAWSSEAIQSELAGMGADAMAAAAFASSSTANAPSPRSVAWPGGSPSQSRSQFDQPASFRGTAVAFRGGISPPPSRRASIDAVAPTFDAEGPPTSFGYRSPISQIAAMSTTLTSPALPAGVAGLRHLVGR